MRKPKLFNNVKTPILFGHRGFKSAFPENTFAAFDACLKYEIPGIEFDVQQCATGELVVIHDFTLNRTAGIQKRVDELSLSELKKLDVGTWFHPDFATETIPTFEEVIQRYKGKLVFDIELKSMAMKNPDFVTRFVELYQKYDLYTESIVSSFNPMLIREVKQKDANIDVGVIFVNDKSLPFYLRYGQGRFLFKTDFIKPYFKQIHRWNRLLLKYIERYPLLTWTVDDAVIAKRLVKAGVDGICSNNALLLKKELQL